MYALIDIFNKIISAFFNVKSFSRSFFLFVVFELRAYSQILIINVIITFLQFFLNMKSILKYFKNMGSISEQLICYNNLKLYIKRDENYFKKCMIKKMGLDVVYSSISCFYNLILIYCIIRRSQNHFHSF